MTSKRFELNELDMDKWAKNTALFLAPAVVVFLTGLAGGKTWSEMAPVMYLWLLNTLLDLTKKFIKDNQK